MRVPSLVLFVVGLDRGPPIPCQRQREFLGARMGRLPTRLLPFAVRTRTASVRIDRRRLTIDDLLYAEIGHRRVTSQ